jgi:hypothetical protein
VRLFPLILAACSPDSVDSGALNATNGPSLALAIDADVATMVRASWDASGSTDSWVEYQLAGDDGWSAVPSTAPGEAVILGVSAHRSVYARLATTADGATSYSEIATIKTGGLPSELLGPTVTVYDPDRASSAPYLMTAVAVSGYTYDGPYWIEIFDREGKIVWYKEVPRDMISMYPTASRDGTHIWYEAENIFGLGAGDPKITRQTLDGRWSSVVDVPDLGQAAAEGPDGAFFVEHRSRNAHSLDRVAADGTVTTEWDCGAWFADHGLSGDLCVMNTCNWDEARNTVLVSQFESDTVFEIDLATGQPIRQMGELEVGDPYAFDPVTSNFAYQHDPMWTSEGTLLVSTHVPCSGGYGCLGVQGQYGIQLASEYAVDDATKTLTRIWTYQSDDLWATQAGEAYRLSNGNLIQGYGQDGAAREVAPDGTVVWEAIWEDRDYSGYRNIGHLELIDDLYALNQGLPE